MRSLYVVIVALCLVFGANASSKLIERAKNAPRDQLKAEIKAVLSPSFRSSLDDSIINFLNTNVRQIMLEGSEELGIPILDPLKIDHLDIDLQMDPIALTGTADGVEVLEISTFVVDKIKTNLLMLNAEFAFHVPEIIAKGVNYNIEGSLSDMIPIYGSGAFEAVVEGLSISGKLYLGSNNSYIYIKQLDLDVNITALTTHFEGLLGGGDLSDLANEVISDMAPEVFENAKPELIPVLSEAVINLANEKLDGVTLQDLLDLINGGGSKKK
ncbi:uncharacterized protein [Periplaneta americana]|uniref:uncharacterized protein n=1 Tax=Periplaneta americana TaxID=6978 RepID=UPI0037E99832